MNYDKFLVFSVLNQDQQTLFHRYASPVNETSLFKSVPLEVLDQMKNIARVLKSQHQRVDAKFRGPRYDAMRCTCLKRHAHSAAIYLRQK
jgi:hypothetical protein